MLRFAAVLLALFALVFQAVAAPKPRVSKDYELSPGDVVAVEVFGEAELSKEYTVSEVGDITFPLIGELNVRGLTTKAIRRQLVEKLKAGYLINPKVNVSVRTFRQVYINGQVKTPNGYAFVPGMTVRKLISIAGGFTERASKRRIFVITEDAKASVKIGLDAEVRPGDVVTVEESFF